MNKSLSGLYAGLIATGPMTQFMLEVQDWLPQAKKSPLPPATLSLELLKRIFPNANPSQNLQTGLTILSHFGYGSLAGILYSQTAGKLTGPTLLKGTLFGVGFWTVNYGGLSPALKLRANAVRMPLERNLMMLLAHVVWGACLAHSEEKLRLEGKTDLAGKRKARKAE